MEIIQGEGEAPLGVFVSPVFHAPHTPDQVPGCPTWMSMLSARWEAEPSWPSWSSSLEQPSSCSLSTLRLRPPPSPSSCCRFSWCRALRSRRCCSRL